MTIDKPLRGKQDYSPSSIEKKWQEVWDREKIYSSNLDKAKKPFYNLMMFPYPSAEGMHVGNMYAFTGADVYGRYMRMKGNDVFEPIGLDGFGIHSENYAIKVGRHPKQQAKISEKNFYRQLRATGNGFDWSRKLETYDPKYYKWTQWLFIQLFKAGLAYRKKAGVNFCPSDKTVLADEQVIDGKCERCGSIVEKKELEQWFFRITKYADRLLKNIEKLDWTEKVKIAQRNWIGKSKGAKIKFKVQSSKFKVEEIEVFTTRPDTLYGATFIVVSPEHPIVAEILKRSSLAGSHLARIRKYVENAKKNTQEERMVEGRDPSTGSGQGKTGVFTGLYAINPLNQEKIPLWIADYAVMGYGTGALFGDAHDKRDVEFAKKYKIPLKPTIMTGDKEKDKRIKNLEECYEGVGILFDSGEFSGLISADAKEKIVARLEKIGKGKRETTYHLRDWLISRQRYWGPPIPMIYCKECAHSASSGQGWQPVPEKDLPVLLPDVSDWKPTGTGKSPLASVESFVNTKCPNCKGSAKRETDVSDTFLDSAWYFFRYLSTDIDSTAFDIDRVKKWLPVEMYIGGAEHSVLHLLYSRFITMVLKDLGFIEFEEPFSRFYAHGLLIKEGAKMSKSKGNVVVPDKYIAKFGADTLRMYLMFLGPFNQGGDFYDTALEGMHRFIKRLWTLVLSIKYQVSSIDEKENINLNRVMHKTIQKVTEDIEHLRYNTAIAHIMEYYNSLHSFYTKYSPRGEAGKILNTKYCKTLVLLIAPFAPHMTEQLFQLLRSQRSKVKSQKFESIHLQPWPTYDPMFLEEDEVTIVVQVNGKVRDTTISQKLKLKSQKYVEEIARESKRVGKYLEGKEIKKVVYVEGKIINFVTDDR